MTETETTMIRHKEAFGTLFKNEWVFRNTAFSIVSLLDDLQEYAITEDPNYRLVVHCLAADGTGHTSNSRHYPQNGGDAGDAHFEIPGRNTNTYAAFRTEIALVEHFLRDTGLWKKVGFGIYPQWKAKGFHLDTREYYARWGMLDGKYTSWSDAMGFMTRRMF